MSSTAIELTTNTSKLSTIHDPELLDLAKKIAFEGSKLSPIAEELASRTRKISVHLANVKTRLAKAGKDGVDGYKSVSDFAEEVFGIKRAMAYQMATAGEKFYIPASKVALPENTTDTSTLAPETKTAFYINSVSPSTLFELNALDYGTVQSLVESNAIGSAKTQAETREIAKAHKPKADPKPDKEYHVILNLIGSKDPAIEYDSVTKEEARKRAAILLGIDEPGDIEFLKLSRKFEYDNSEWTHAGSYIAVSVNGAVFVDLITVKTAKSTKPKTAKPMDGEWVDLSTMSDEELQAYIEARALARQK